MATAKRFKNNAAEESVSIGRGQNVIRGIAPSDATELPEATVSITIDGAKFTMPEPMPTPQLPEEYQPKMVEAKVALERIKTEDEQVMNTGMEKFLEYMPLDAAELIREYAQDNAVPLWQVIGGYVMRAREQAELFSPIILPDWAESIAPNAVRPCGTCGEGMKSAVAGQMFCCNFCYHGKPTHNPDCVLVKEEAA